MKSFASLLARHELSSSAASAVSSACPATCTIRMTVDAQSVTTLRQLAMRVCGDALEFMRIAVCTGGARMQVWLCVQLPFAAILNEAIARQLPGACFDACKTGKAAGQRA